MTDDLAARRRRLDEAMAECGAWPQKSPWLREAVAALPRDRFAPDRLWRWDGHAYLPVDRASDPRAWAGELYDDQNAAAITQLSSGIPSSSLSATGIVVDMLDSLALEPGHRVWDIGTGQGWNAALAAWRAGPGRVVSTELDPGLAAFARGRLTAAGLDVGSTVGDATTTPPGPGRFDRVIATYAVERVPWAWVEATRPGGRLVVPWGRLGYVALTVADDHGEARGWVHGLARFMADRTQDRGAAFAAVRADRPADDEHPADLAFADLAEDWNLRFALRVALADVQLTTGPDDTGATAAWLHDGAASWAVLSPTGADGRVTVRQGGPRRLADELTAAREQWARLGSPHPYDYGMTVRPDEQYVWLTDPHTGPRWTARANAFVPAS
ncbi:methyltransferase domain-containing protein [Kitasatospora sp. NPDC054939]